MLSTIPLLPTVRDEVRALILGALALLGCWMVLRPAVHPRFAAGLPRGTVRLIFAGSVLLLGELFMVVVISRTLSLYAPPIGNPTARAAVAIVTYGVAAGLAVVLALDALSRYSREWVARLD